MNYLKKQYLKDNGMMLSHNYLQEQFSNIDQIIEEIRSLVKRGDYTLGEPVTALENQLVEFTKGKYAVTTGSGTDAITLSLMACEVGPGDEVITTPFTFFATVGAIISTGATPVFCDIGDDFNINYRLIEEKITTKTKAILPVHWAGEVADMKNIRSVATANELSVVEDACHAFGAYSDGVHPGACSQSIAAFSLHPLKNLNCWGDGGFVITGKKNIAEKIKLLRNHGLQDREHCSIWGRNSRLDSIQAIVASWLLKRQPSINDKRRNNAQILDQELNHLRQITLPKRKKNIKSSFHLYSFLAEKRDELSLYLRSFGIDAKIHYPIPMHLQPAAKLLGYKVGDFPIAERVARETISLPVHEYIQASDLKFMVTKIKEFYGY